MKQMNRWAAWVAALALACGLAACGGGGGGNGDTAAPLPAAVADSRNGDYRMYVADGQLYTLTLDFDARSWRLAGNATDSQGTFTADGSDFVFDPVGAAPARNNARFSTVTDGVVGGFRFATGVVPFVAARSFATTVEDAAGAYKFLTRVTDPSLPVNNFIFTTEIAPPNIWRQCNDNIIFTIAACPAASLITGTVTVAGDEFTTTVPAGTYSFRVARIGGSRVYLRAGPTAGNSAQRRFWVGVEQAAGFADATFDGVNTAAQSASTVFAGTTLSSTLRTEGNATLSRTGTTRVAGVPGLLAINTIADGGFFAMRSNDLAFVFAARDNPAWPGYVEIGRLRVR